MEFDNGIADQLTDRARQVKAIVAQGHYQVAGGRVEVAAAVAACVAGARLIRPDDWDGIIDQARARCTAPVAARIEVTDESTLEALERLAVEDPARDLAALNFASARKPGGGWDTGARAQEESLGRASALVASLLQCPDYYSANRASGHLFYTDHAIWSPGVPCFARDDGSLLAQAYQVGFVTMPAPNVGAMQRMTEADLRALPGLWRRRITCVLALCISQGMRRIVLGAWGCGVFRNDPVLVARWFREVLAEPAWARGCDRITFAIHDSARGKPCLQAFRSALALGAQAEQGGRRS
jgi:uncharacterized protein (TIGR02452 family)